jgi:uncharacterized protein
MKKITLLVLLSFIFGSLLAQQNSDVVDMKKHHIVMQFTDGDGDSQATVTGQIKNILTAWPNAEVEIVCHGAGLDLLTTVGSKASSALTELSSKGVIFSACNNTLRRRNIKKEDLLQLTLRQEEGWAYVKGGH